MDHSLPNLYRQALSQAAAIAAIALGLWLVSLLPGGTALQGKVPLLALAALGAGVLMWRPAPLAQPGPLTRRVGLGLAAAGLAVLVGNSLF